MALPQPERRIWGGSLGIALAAHVGVAGLVLALANPLGAPEPDAVMIVELPPMPGERKDEAPAPAPQQVRQLDPRPVTPVQPSLPRIDAPQIARPVPADALTVPVRPVQVAPSPQPVAAPQPAPARDTSSAPSGDDPRAKQAQLNYYQTLMAYLARRKQYPAEAKKAGQQGVVTVRFTIDRKGNVSGEGIKKSSGHAVLDNETLALLRRVSPLPAMPASMKQDSVTLSLPIEYTLTRK